jgi:hypothetical protein
LIRGSVINTVILYIKQQNKIGNKNKQRNSHLPVALREELPRQIGEL